MAIVQLYDETFDVKGWFDPTTTDAGWFDDDWGVSGAAPVPQSASDSTIISSSETSGVVVQITGSDTTSISSSDSSTVDVLGPNSIVIHPSSPAPVIQGNTNQANTVTASFTPPDHSVLLIMYGSSSAANTTLSSAPTISNTGSLSTTLVAWRKTTVANGQAAMWTAPVNTSPGSMTVTVTHNQSLNRQAKLAVYVLTGVDLTTPVASFNSGPDTTGVLDAPSLTTTTAGSLTYLVANDYDNSAGTMVADDSNTVILWENGAGVHRTAFLRQYGPQSVGSTITLGMTGASSVHWEYVQAEMNPEIISITPKSASDTTDITSSDSSATTAQFPATDTTNISSSETSSFSQVNFTSNDTGRINFTNAASAPAYIGASAVSSGTTSAAPTYPAGLVADALILLVATSKYSYPDSAPSGWTLLRQQSSGRTASGVDSGSVYLSVYSKDSVSGSESGTVSISLTGGNSIAAAMVAYSPVSGYTQWEIDTAADSWFGTGTAWNVTSIEQTSLRSNDLILVASSANTDTYSFSAEAVALTGATFSGATEVIDSAITAGDDQRMIVSRHTVTTPATGNLNYQMTASSSNANGPTGSTIFVVLRSIAATTSETTDIQVAASISGSDTTDISSSETTTTTALFTKTDTTDISSSEVATLLSTLSRTDTTDISSTETTVIVPTPLYYEEETFEGKSGAVTNGTIFESALNSGSSSSSISTANPRHGSSHARFTAVSNTSRAVADFDILRSLIYVRWYFYFNTLPTGNNTIMGTFDAPGSTTIRSGVQLQAGGTLRIRNASTAVDTGTTALSTGTWYRGEIKLDYANSTQELRIWTGGTIDSANASDAIVLKSSNKFLTGALTSGTLGSFLVGSNDTPGTTVVHDVDGVAWGFYDWIGPYDTGITPVSGSDTTDISSSETSNLAITTYVSTTDTTDISSSETATILSTLSRTDTTDISSSETATILSTLSRTDTTDISSSETASILSTLSRTDTTDISSSETAAILSTLTRTDTTDISSSETAAILSTLSRTDTTDISSSETVAFGQINFSTTDTTLITSIDASSQTATFPGSDATLISSSETSDVQISGAFNVSTSDTTDISSSETAVNFVTISTTDTTSITSAETTAFGQINFTRTDTTDISSAETATILSTLSRTDTTDISSSETTLTQIAFTRTDTTDISSSETASILSTLSRTDTTDISSSETASILSTLSRTDTTDISSTETSSISVTTSTTDSTLITSSDSSSIAVTLSVSASDSTNISSSETSDVDAGATQLIRHHERFNGGSDGTAITSGNSLFTLFPGTGTMDFSNTYSIQGGTSGKFVSTNAAQGKRGKIENLVSRRTWYMRFYYRKVGNPSAVNRFAIFETAASASPPGDDIAGIREEASGNLTLFNGSSFVTGTPITSLATGWHRIELKVDRDGTLSTLRVWSGANMHSTGTADQEIQVALTDNANEISVVGIGNYNAVNQTRYIEDFAVGDQAWIGPSANIDVDTTDSTDVSSTETSAIMVPVSATDTTDISSSETKALLASFSGTDTTSITSSETVSFPTITFSTTDTTSISSTDSGAPVAMQPGSDNTQISSSETTDIQVSGGNNVSANDTTDISSSETKALLSILSRTDTTDIASSESSSIASTLNRTDSTDIGSTETSSLFVSRPTTDSTDISSSETATIFVSISSSDTTNITSSETSGFSTVIRSTSDTTSITSSETSSIAGTMTASDSTIISSTDSGTAVPLIPGTDTTTISSSETSQIDLIGTIQVSASDSTNISSSETSALAASSTRTDTTSITSVDSSQIFVTVTASDSTSISSVEGRSFNVQTPTGSDSTAIGSTETSDVFILIIVTSDDTTEISSDETSSKGAVTIGEIMVHVDTQEASEGVHSQGGSAGHVGTTGSASGGVSSGGKGSTHIGAAGSTGEGLGAS